MAELSLGVLIDIIDEEWMQDTLSDDGKWVIDILINFILHFFVSLFSNLQAYSLSVCLHDFLNENFVEIAFTSLLQILHYHQ